MSMINAEPIVMALVATNVFTRWDCDICGGCTEKVSPLCEGVAPDGRGIRCCETCLEAGQDQLDARLLRHIAGREKYGQRYVEFLKGIVGRVKVPTYAEWEAAYKAENAAAERADLERELAHLAEQDRLHAERSERANALSEKIAAILIDVLSSVGADLPEGDKVPVRVGDNTHLAITAAGIHHEDVGDDEVVPF